MSICSIPSRVISMRRFCNKVVKSTTSQAAAAPQGSPPGFPRNEPIASQIPKRQNGNYVPNFEFTLAQAGLVVACGMSILGIVKLNELALERRKTASQTAIVTEERIGKPKLGGPWTLYDCRTAKPVTSEELKGKYQLVYFGFTYCPDICPEELEKQRAVVEGIDKALAQTGQAGCVQPVFITVDPRRDTLAQTRMYVREFHPKLLGLTGPPDMIKKVTKMFRVYYNEGIKATDGVGGEEDYLVDHSIIHYLMSPDNELVDFYGKNLTAEETTHKILAEIRKANALKQQAAKLAGSK